MEGDELGEMEVDPSIIRAEITEVIEKLWSNRTPGVYKCCSEFLKHECCGAVLVNIPLQHPVDTGGGATELEN